MARYRWLQDGFVDGAYYSAGDIVTMADNWSPPAAVDPLDTAAVNAFYSAGVRIMPILVRQQWSTVFVAQPVTYWKQIPGGNFWQLTGLGANLPPIGM